MKKSPVASYLESRAVTGPWRIAGSSRCDFAAAVVIPSLAEGDSLFATLESLQANPPQLLKKTLILVVVNQRVDAPAEQRQGNLGDLLRLAQKAEKGPLQLAWVDAASAGLELALAEGGVGLARKIGLDLALCRLDPHSDPFLACLDADTLVDRHYLSTLFDHFATSRQGGAAIPFRHRDAADPAEQSAIERYELFLRHYVLGLELAGSPYAYHTVGSALACRAEAYAKAGGMNKRPAGEDFYFLQQLAKTSGVGTLQGTTVFPSPRPSERTPFGTGRSVAKLMAGESSAVTFYDPRCFTVLGRWLGCVEQSLGLPGEALLHQAGTASPHLADHLQSIGLVATWDRLQGNHRQPAALLRAFHGWFDALKTLRLIHHLCAGPYPKVEPGEALPGLLAEAGIDPQPSVCAALAALRLHQGANSP